MTSIRIPDETMAKVQALAERIAKDTGCAVSKQGAIRIALERYFEDRRL